MAETTKKTVSLVLGSGGARGLAHIGVIHWLEENGYQIRSIAGCSMGALVGGIYAAGKLDDYERWVRAITKVDIITLLDLSWDMSGLVKGDKIINTLIELVGEQLIEDLPIKYTAVATDLMRHKEIWINSGRLFDAIRASMSFPLLFTPFSYKGVDLIDGGVLNPVPVSPAIGEDTDLTIAVNLCGTANHADKGSEMRATPAPAASPLHNKVNYFIRHLQQSVTNHSGRDWSAHEIALQAFEAMQSTIARQKLAVYPPDILIEIPRNACRTLEYDRAAEMIDLGYHQAKKYLS
jgi:NTE family protein